MIIRRIRLTLPARMRATAAHDARHLAESLALDLARRDAPPGQISLSLDANGNAASALAPRLTAALPSGGSRVR